MGCQWFNIPEFVSTSVKKMDSIFPVCFHKLIWKIAQDEVFFVESGLLVGIKLNRCESTMESPKHSSFKNIIWHYYYNNYQGKGKWIRSRRITVTPFCVFTWVDLPWFVFLEGRTGRLACLRRIDSFPHLHIMDRHWHALSENLYEENGAVAAGCSMAALFTLSWGFQPFSLAIRKTRK